MSEIALQKVQSGPGGPKVGHGPLLNANCLRHKDRKKWTDLQRETYPQEDTSEVAHFRQLLSEFLASCKAEGRSQQATLGLRHRVPKLMAYLDENALDLSTLGPREAQGYIGWLSAQRSVAGSLYSGRTVAAYLSAASVFCHYAKGRGLLVADPFREVHRPRVEKKLPRRILKEAEMKSLLDELARFDEPPELKSSLARYRLHVIAELMYATGLRVSEVASLRVSDIDFEASTVTVREAKGGYPRVAFLGEFALEVLRLYVETVRAKAASAWNEAHGELLFGAGWDWFGHTVNRQLARTCAALGLPAMSSHGFRHAVGFHLLRAGCNIRHIQSILGHRRLRNTEVYTKVDKEDLREVVDSCHPRKWSARDGGT